MKLRNSEDKSDATERLHDDYRRESEEEKSDEEWIELQRYGGGAET